MAITVTELVVHDSDIDASTYTTASVSVGANRLLLLCIVSRGNSGTTISSITGTLSGVTWVEINSDVFGTNRELHVYRAMRGSAGSGTIAVNFSATQRSAQVFLYECDGVDTTGTNGSGAVGSTGQTVDESMADTDTITVTLAAFAASTNTTFAVCASKDECTGVAFEGAYTEEQDSAGANTRMAVGHLIGTEDNSVVMTLSVTGTTSTAAFACELQAASVGPVDPRREKYLMGAGF